MANLRTICGNLNKQGKNYAGYVADGKFCYHVSDCKAIPAAAFILDHLGKGKRAKMRKGRVLKPGTGDASDVFANVPSTHWIRTYFQNVTPCGTGLLSALPDIDVAEAPITPAPKLTVNAEFRRVAPPLAGGLYAAATTLVAGHGESGTQKGLKGRARGLERALRYYMLASYSILALCKQEGYKGGNYVAAILVSDKGEILSFGLNNGGESRSSYHHAEVNMLMSYFQGHKNDDKFESNSIVFSTLTPCMQCTGYLTQTKPTDCRIFFGQMDTGESGKAGKTIGGFEGLSDVTKPLRGCEVTTSGILKVAIDEGLNNCTYDGQIAGSIGKSDSALLLLETALNSLLAKWMKERKGAPTPEEREEDAIKEKVLNYLRDWLLSIDLNS